MILRIYNYDTDAFTEFEKDEQDLRTDYAFVYDILLDYDLPDWVFANVTRLVSEASGSVDVTIKIKGVMYSYTVLASKELE